VHLQGGVQDATWKEDLDKVLIIMYNFKNRIAKEDNVEEKNLQEMEPAQKVYQLMKVLLIAYEQDPKGFKESLSQSQYRPAIIKIIVEKGILSSEKINTLLDHNTARNLFGRIPERETSKVKADFCKAVCWNRVRDKEDWEPFLDELIAILKSRMKPQN
jgi:hypothetical protein